MTELEMYKELVKAQHNQYIGVIRELEDVVHDAYVSELIPRFDNVDIEDALLIMHTIFNIVCKTLKENSDVTIKTIESEMENDKR